MNLVYSRLRMPLTIVMLVAIVAVALTPSFGAPQAAHAQGEFECPVQLAPEDCEILETALNAGPTVESVNIDNVSLVIEFDLGEEEGSGSVYLEASGPIVITDGDVPLEADITLNGEADLPEPDGQESIEGARLVIVDGVAYTYDPETEEWEAEEADEGDMAGLEADLEDLDLEEILGVVTEYSDAAWINFARLDDTEYNGQSVAVFSLDLLLGELLVSDDFAELIGLALETTGEESISASDVSLLIGFIAGDLKPQLDESVVNTTLYIDPATGYFAGMELTLDFNLDLAFLAALAGEGGGDIPPISIFVDVDVETSQYNEEFVIEAPEVE